MAESDDLLKQFAEFMESKRQSEAESEPESEVEIWDKEGNGARVPRSAAKGFLNKFGIDIDEPPADDDSGGDTKGGKSKPAAKPKTPNSSSASGQGPVTRYFAKRPAGKLDAGTGEREGDIYRAG